MKRSLDRSLAFLAGWILVPVGIYAARVEPLNYLVWLAPLLGAGVVLLSRSENSPLVRLPGRVFLSLALAVFLATRLAWVFAVPSMPFSDFAGYEVLANLIARGQPFSPELGRGYLLTPWGYPLGLGGWFALFGSGLLSAKLFNLLAGAVSALLLYRFAARFGDGTARLATLLFVLWPAQMIFSSVLASEHLSLLFLLAALIYLSRLIFDNPCSHLKTNHQDTKTPRITKKLKIFVLLRAFVSWWLALFRRPLSAPGLSDRLSTADGSVSGARPAYWREAVLAGIALAAGFAVRPALGVVLLAAILCIWISARPVRERAAKSGLLLLVFLLGYGAFLAGMRVFYQVTPVAQGSFALLTGTNVQSDGGWNQEDADRFFSYPTLQEANRFAVNEALRRITSDPARFVRLMGRKILRTWGDDTHAFDWSTSQLEKSRMSPRTEAILPHIAAFSQYFYLFLLVFAAVGCFRLAASNNPAPEYGLILVILFAAILLHAVLEAQPRYHYPLTPLLALLACRGILAGAPERGSVPSTAGGVLS